MESVNNFLTLSQIISLRLFRSDKRRVSHYRPNKKDHFLLKVCSINSEKIMIVAKLYFLYLGKDCFKCIFNLVVCDMSTFIDPSHPHRFKAK